MIQDDTVFYSERHFNQSPRRKAEFITPPNTIKQKVGSGGLSEEILERAEELLENYAVDFLPLAEIYLDNLMKGIRVCQNPPPGQSAEYLISTMLYPGMQLKANGGMFHYPLVTVMADKLIQFLEVIETPDDKAVEIVIAFHATIKMVVQARIQGEPNAKGRSLVKALNEACERYFKKFT